MTRASAMNGDGLYALKSSLAQTEAPDFQGAEDLERKAVGGRRRS